MNAPAGTYLALLRGINVGGQHEVPMARLRALLTGLGFADVRTHLRSGNVLFRTTGPDGAGAVVSDPKGESEIRLETRLETALREEFGFEVPVLVRTPDELRRALDDSPWSGAELDASKVLLLFVREQPAPNHFAELDAERFAPDQFRLIDRVVYCYFPNGMGRSKLGPALQAVRPQLTMTGRNWRTVRTLLEMAERS